MATLREQQVKFARDLAELVLWIDDQPGYECTIAEVLRPQIVQNQYLREGTTKVMHSKHQDKLAADIMIYKAGVYLTKTEDYAFMGAHWKSLDTENVWGGDWKSIRDGNHVQRGV